MLRVIEEALTYDDVLLVPAYSEVLPNNVELKTQLTKGISLNIPSSFAHPFHLAAPASGTASVWE